MRLDLQGARYCALSPCGRGRINSRCSSWRRLRHLHHAGPPLGEVAAGVDVVDRVGGVHRRRRAVQLHQIDGVDGFLECRAPVQVAASLMAIVRAFLMIHQDSVRTGAGSLAPVFEWSAACDQRVFPCPSPASNAMSINFARSVAWTLSKILEM